jgi:hypothetical protein
MSMRIYRGATKFIIVKNENGEKKYMKARVEIHQL